MPARIFPRVLLPAPFSPQMAWQAPDFTSKLTSESAATPGKRFVTLENAIADISERLYSRRTVGPQDLMSSRAKRWICFPGRALYRDARSLTAFGMTTR